MIRLSMTQVITLHDELIRETGGRLGLRDESMLDAALNAPFHSFSGADAYPSIQHKAARLGFSLIQNHPFIDGNKRTGAHVMLVFLELNGIELAYEQGELTMFILQIAKGEVDTPQILQWILDHEIR